MKSIFHSKKTVTVDGTAYRIDADVGITGGAFFRVTNTETGERSRMIRRRGRTPVENGYYSTACAAEWAVAALEAAPEVDL